MIEIMVADYTPYLKSWSRLIRVAICICLVCLAGLAEAFNVQQGVQQSEVAKDSLAPNVPQGLFTPPRQYNAPRVGSPIVIDGDLSDQGWQKVPWSEKFSDIAGNSVLKNVHIDRPDQIWPTQIKLCWDDTYLYIAAKLVEPDLWASLKQPDTIIYHNNDFEVFFATGASVNSYYELEINQLGTLLDLLMTRPYRNGGQAIIHWDLKGLKSAVGLHGTLNTPGDKDSCWTVEMAIPFKGVRAFGQRNPRLGDYWRINFSRVQWDAHPTTSGYHRDSTNGRLHPEHNWVWSQQGIINMHAPDRWGYLFFVKDSASRPALPIIELQKAVLWKIYYAEQFGWAQHHKFALTLGELGVPDSKVVLTNPQNSKKESFWLRLRSGQNWFRACLIDQNGREILALDQNGLFRILH